MMRLGIIIKRGLPIAIANASSSSRLRLSPRISRINGRSCSSFVALTKYFPDRRGHDDDHDHCLLHLENPNHLVQIPNHPFGPDKNDDADTHLGTAGVILVRQRSTGTFALLNSSTGVNKYHIVPPNPAGDLNVSLASFGPHELVTFIVNDPPEQEQGGGFRALDLMVYDAINNSWRHIVQPKQLRSNWDYCLYAKNCLYLSLNMSKGTMLGFDLEQEEYFDSRLPDFGHEIQPYVTRMCVFDGNLCLVSYWKNLKVPNKPGCEMVEVWVTKLKRFSCWTRLCSISDPKTRVEITQYVDERFAWYGCDMRYVPLIPMCYSACRNKVLFDVESKSLAWYDLETKEFEVFEFEESCGNVIAMPLED